MELQILGASLLQLVATGLFLAVVFGGMLFIGWFLSERM